MNRNSVMSVAVEAGGTRVLAHAGLIGGGGLCTCLLDISDNPGDDRNIFAARSFQAVGRDADYRWRSTRRTRRRE